MLKKIIVLLSACFLLASCAPSSSSKTLKIAFWGNIDEVKVITKMAKQWEKQHPDWKVQLIHSPGGTSYISKILTQVAGGDAPDIAFSEVNVFVPMMNKGVFLDLTPFIKKDTSFNLSEFYPEEIKRFTRDGKLYCIPRDTAPFACVYYNKTLFYEAGIKYPTDDWDFNDLIKIAQKLTKTDSTGKISQYGFYSWCWMNFVYSFGGNIVDNVEKPTRCVLDSKEAIKGLQFYKDLCTKYKVSITPVALNASQQGSTDLFKNGKIAMLNSGIWETPQIRSVKTFDWDVVMFPKGPVRRAFGTGGSGYCIIRTTKHPEEAWDLLKTLSGDYGQEELAKIGLAQPANRRLAQGTSWAKNTDLPLNKGMLDKAVQHVIYEPFNSKWQEAQDKYVTPYIDMFFSDQMTAEQFTKEAVERINQTMFN